jgi:hypothetical protein
MDAESMQSLQSFSGDRNRGLQRRGKIFEKNALPNARGAR